MVDGKAGPTGGPGTPSGDGQELEPAHCTSCGEPSTLCAGCGRPLDPPRFCGACGTRLAVRVSPNGYVGRCKHHGEVARS